MTTRELTRFALGGLWRQKVRTALTLIGVAVGTCALAFSLSLGFGLRAFIEYAFQSRDVFWRVIVVAGEPSPEAKAEAARKVKLIGRFSPEREARLREAIGARELAASDRGNTVLLTPAKLAEIAALPDVQEVRVYRMARGQVWEVEGAKRPDVDLTAGSLAELAPRLIAGRLPESDDAKEIVLSELALYDLGLGDEDRYESAVGKTVRLKVGGVGNVLAQARALIGRLPTGPLSDPQKAALEKLTAELPRSLHLLDLTDEERRELSQMLSGKVVPAEGTYRVCGVVRVMTEEDRKKGGPLAPGELAQGHAFLAPGAGRELLSRLPTFKAGAVSSADVRVRPGGDMPATAAAIKAMGYQALSLAEWFTEAKREAALISAGLSLFAMMALFVAGVGITNTLVSSVVERTKEIGILRAVGASQELVRGLFLVEGAFVGLLGSVLGLGLARVLAVPADHWLLGYLQEQLRAGQMHEPSLFVFPWWLWVGSVAFAVLVATAAAYPPARRAARINPIEALRFG